MQQMQEQWQMQDFSNINRPDYDPSQQDEYGQQIVEEMDNMMEEDQYQNQEMIYGQEDESNQSPIQDQYQQQPQVYN